MPEIIASRKFTLNDQVEFSIFSGDKNPIHLDEIASRKTVYGRPIVHGVHAVMWALDSLAVANELFALKVKCKFLKPIFLDETLVCEWDQQKRQILIKVDDALLISIILTLGSTRLQEKNSRAVNIPRKKPLEPSFIDCLNLVDCPLKIYGDVRLGDKLFPNFLAAYGELVASEFGAISQVVGMECPGLHSLFASLNIEIRHALISGHNPQYAVKGEERFRLLIISVNASMLTAELEVFYRPTPVENPPFSNLIKHVARDEFVGKRALIIGGSRGLGALIAKIFAAGGGVPIITYNVGKLEAYKLREEIFSFGGTCEVIQMSVKGGSTLSSDLCFDQLYYFPTPKILGKRSASFDQLMLDHYREIYVKALKSICQNLISSGHKCSFFYPSTIFASSSINEYEDYVTTKVEGEKACQTLEESGILKFIIVRLPRLQTDQNQNMLDVKLDDAVDLLIPLVREMQKI